MKATPATLAVALCMAAQAAGQTPAPDFVPQFPIGVPAVVDSLPPPAVATVAVDSVPTSFPVVPYQMPRGFSSPYAVSNGTPPYMNSSNPRLFESRRDSGGCASGMCGTNGCAVCGPAGRVWAEVDFLLWRASGDPLPALATTSPLGTAPAAAGVLGVPGTTLLAGRTNVNDDLRSGIRYAVGAWLNPEQTLGLQVGGFNIEDVSDSTVFSAAGGGIIARPFFNVLTGAETSNLVAFPGVSVGSIGIDGYNRVYGFDAAVRGNMCCAPCWRLDALLGYRHLRIEDGLTVTDVRTAGPLGPAPVGTTFAISDRFETSNTFNGVQAGVAGEWRFAPRWFVNGSAKASFGWVDQVVDVGGLTVRSSPGLNPALFSGGLLALSSNIGRTSTTDAIIVPELNVNLGYDVNSIIRLRAGYSFLYLNSVARPGAVIDTTINPNLIPPAAGATAPARPTVLADRDDFFLHGVNAGVELRY